MVTSQQRKQLQAIMDELCISVLTDKEGKILNPEQYDDSIHDDITDLVNQTIHRANDKANIELERVRVEQYAQWAMTWPHKIVLKDGTIIPVHNARSSEKRVYYQLAKKDDVENGDVCSTWYKGKILPSVSQNWVLKEKVAYVSLGEIKEVDY